MHSMHCSIFPFCLFNTYIRNIRSLRTEPSAYGHWRMSVDMKIEPRATGRYARVRGAGLVVRHRPKAEVRASLRHSQPVGFTHQTKPIP